MKTQYLKKMEICKIEIIEYFDNLINRIDISAETLLELILDDEDADNVIKNKINTRRICFIDKIEALKNYNLTLLNENKEMRQVTKEKMFARYCFILNKHDVNIRKYLTSNGKEEEYIQKDQFYGKNIDLIINETFGVLIILDSFLPDWKLDLYKELLNLLDSNNDKQTNDNKDLNENTQSTFNSSIFEANCQVQVIISNFANIFQVVILNFK